MAAEEAGVKVGEHIYGVLTQGVPFLPGGFNPMTSAEFNDLMAAKFPGIIPTMWQTVHVDTVLYSWIIMALLLGFGFVASRGLSRVPSGGQTLAESLVDFSQNTVKNFIGPEVAPYLWYIGSLFMFILTANWLGVLPWSFLHSLHLPAYHAPTGDINTTAGLALLSFSTFYFFGFAHKGIGYFKHFVTPQWWLLPFLIIEDLSRPLSLALRLFANVTAGHVIIAVLLFLVPMFVPLPLMGLEIFVGAIQAFIFAALSASYIGAAISHEH